MTTGVGPTEIDEEKLHNEVIHHAYAMTTDPTRFAVLSAMVTSKLLAIYAADSQDLSNPSPRHYERYDEWRTHMNNALNLLELQGRANQKVETLEEQLDAAPEPVLLIDEHGVIIHLNPAALEVFGLNPGDILDPRLFDDDAHRELSAHMQRIPFGGARGILQIVAMSTSGKSMRGNQNQRHVQMALATEVLRDGRSVAKLTAAETIWTDTKGAAFQKAFNLTDIEQDIARAVMENVPLPELANQRDRSLNTIKTQTKTLFKKLSLGSQIELTRLYSGFQQLETGTPLTNADIDMLKIARPFGRQLEVRFLGPEEGAPVLYFHDALYGMFMTKNILKELRKRNIRLICICRPGFANSSPAREGENTPAHHAEDALAVLDFLKIDKIPLLALLSGAIPAYALAKAARKCVSSITIVSGTTPLNTKRVMDRVAPLLKAMFLSARYMPEIVPFFTRARIAFTDAVPAKTFLADHVPGSPADLRALDDEDLSNMLLASRNEAMRQGYQSFTDELILMANDWTRYIPKSKIPIKLIYGKEDGVNPPDTVKEFSAELANATVQFVDDTGRLAFFRDPAAVLSEIEITYAD